MASVYGITASKVEGAIRGAIKTAWRNGDVEEIQKYFDYNRKPKNKEFIATIADHLRMQDGKVI